MQTRRTGEVMQLGAVYPQTELGGDPEAVRHIGLAVEQQGYDYLLAYDHVLGAVHDDRDPPLRGPYTEHDPFHDPFVMFAHLAGITERLEFATGVLILPQRQTVLVAKQAADVDLLSGGRLRLGVGVGWNHVEYTALDKEFGNRGRRADEQIGLLRTLWGGGVQSFDGEFEQVERGALVPGPRRQIPIWIGGFSPPAFRRGVELGDGFIFAGNEEMIHGALDQVEAIAADAGRDLSSFGLECLMVRSSGGVDDTMAAAERWEARGGTHFAAVSMGAGRDSTEAHLDFFAEIAEHWNRARSES
ncbi:MAG: LLM class F420-dependent oxidoreductase [Actinomycetota bacterium]